MVTVLNEDEMRGAGGGSAAGRWVASYAAYGVPQAAAPITFSLLALPLTGSARSGAELVFVMTAAQILGAVPITRLGRRFDPNRFLRVLLVTRTVSFGVLAVVASQGATIGILFPIVAASGLVGGAAYGYQRAFLNAIVEPKSVPRVLAVATTLNEVTFVAAPVIAAVLGTVSPALAVLMFAVLGAFPLLLLPPVPHPLDGADPFRRPMSSGSRPRLLTGSVVVVLLCSIASAAVVAAIETGAVAIAIGYGLPAELGASFTVALCVCSITGGAWISFAKPPSSPGMIPPLLLTTLAGAILIALNQSPGLTIIGAALVGSVLAPLATLYSLTIDRVAASARKAEAFALLRTTTSLGVVVAAGLVSTIALTGALLTCAALISVATISATIWTAQRRRTVLVRSGH